MLSFDISDVIIKIMSSMNQWKSSA